MKTNNYYWNEETINHFKFESSYITKEETIENITTFVENFYSLKDGESEDDLIEDLINQIFLQN